MVKRSTALKRHSFEFYKELEKRSEVNEYGIRVFVGKTTQVTHYLGISTSYYSQIINVLIASDCIRIIQRGTGRQPSIVVLVSELTDENYSEEGLTSAAGRAILVASLEKRVAALEAWRISIGGDKVNFADTMRNHESRLSRVEERVQRSNE